MNELNKRNKRVLLSLNPYAMKKMESTAAKVEKPLATLCADIIKMVLRGELRTSDGKNYFDTLSLENGESV